MKQPYETQGQYRHDKHSPGYDRSPLTDSWVWTVPNFEPLRQDQKDSHDLTHKAIIQFHDDDDKVVINPGQMVLLLLVSSLLGFGIAVTLYVTGFGLFLSFCAYIASGGALFLISIAAIWIIREIGHS